jgi:ubiquitin C-terminal hydrolase
MWENYLCRNNSAITDIFCGQFKSTVECGNCKRVTRTFDVFLDLSVPVPRVRGGGLLH